MIPTNEKVLNGLKHKTIRVSLLAVVAVLALAFAVWQIINSRSFQFFGGIVNHVKTDEKAVALTFDDGPNERTGQILEILKHENAKATFFLVGQSMEQYPDEARRIAADGHQVGNHSWSHSRMIFRSLSFIGTEIEKTDSLIRSAGYEGAIQFRPPNGKKLVLLPYYLKQHDRKTILWDLEPNSIPEVNESTEKIVDYVVENAQPGSIILLHAMYDSKGTTIDAIAGIIEGLRSKGYDFVTVNSLISYSNK